MFSGSFCHNVNVRCSSSQLRLSSCNSRSKFHMMRDIVNRISAKARLSDTLVHHYRKKIIIEHGLLLSNAISWTVRKWLKRISSVVLEPLISQPPFRNKLIGQVEVPTRSVRRPMMDPNCRSCGDKLPTNHFSRLRCLSWERVGYGRIQPKRFMKNCIQERQVGRA
jgi:hypothetical protein